MSQARGDADHQAEVINTESSQSRPPDVPLIQPKTEPEEEESKWTILALSTSQWRQDAGKKTLFR